MLELIRVELGAALDAGEDGVLEGGDSIELAHGTLSAEKVGTVGALDHVFEGLAFLA